MLYPVSDLYFTALTQISAKLTPAHVAVTTLLLFCHLFTHASVCSRYIWLAYVVLFVLGELNWPTIKLVKCPPLPFSLLHFASQACECDHLDRENLPSPLPQVVATSFYHTGLQGYRVTRQVDY